MGLKSEDRLTQDCYLWFHRTYPEYRGLLFHVPNGGMRTSREAQRLKSMGVWKGVSDFIFLWNGRAYFIELKTKHKDSKQSSAQISWQQMVERNGFTYWIARDLDLFQDIIKTIMKNGKV